MQQDSFKNHKVVYNNNLCLQYEYLLCIETHAYIFHLATKMNLEKRYLMYELRKV